MESSYNSLTAKGEKKKENTKHSLENSRKGNPKGRWKIGGEGWKDVEG